ncbi:hypothetical protein QCA50_007727 [Cerrena zonata]|uniref:DUF6534 domain-containing protein n=1 Tax=Cerrena zonata TaxID=2478898 RepID=A0AAW0G8H9_9APHY
MSMLTISYIIGGFIEGIGIANVFYGISIAQAYVYMKKCDKDPQWIQWLAAGVMLLETGNTIFLQRQQFFYSVLAIENSHLVTRIDWSVPTAVGFEILSEIIVQCFYIHRMWMFSKNLILTVGTVILLICRHGIFMYCMSDTIKYDTWTELHVSKGFMPSLISTATIIVLSDGIIAVTMAYYLYRSQSQLRRRACVIYLIQYVALLTGVMKDPEYRHLAYFVLRKHWCYPSYVAAPNSLLFCAFIILYARAVSNALFGALNARHVLRAKIEQPITLGRTSLYSGSAVFHESHSIRVDMERCTPGVDNPKTIPDSSENGNKATNTLEYIPE